MTTCTCSNPDVTAVAYREDAASGEAERRPNLDALAPRSTISAFVTQLTPKGPTS
jgi:hypothetical protein